MGATLKGISVTGGKIELSLPSRSELRTVWSR